MFINGLTFVIESTFAPLLSDSHAAAKMTDQVGVRVPT